MNAVWIVSSILEVHVDIVFRKDGIYQKHRHRNDEPQNANLYKISVRTSLEKGIAYQEPECRTISRFSFEIKECLECRYSIQAE